MIPQQNPSSHHETEFPSGTGCGRAGSARSVPISMSGARTLRPPPGSASGTATTPAGSRSSPAATAPNSTNRNAPPPTPSYVSWPPMARWPCSPRRNEAISARQRSWPARWRKTRHA